jgi:acetyl-CoA synthetase
MRFFEPGHYKRGQYDTLCREFSWNIPKHYNMGVAASRYANVNPQQIALYYENDNGAEKQFTFGELESDSNRLANALNALGVAPGDRVGIVLPQRYEAGLAHVAVYKTGAIALPLSVMFGEDAMLYRLQDSGAKVIIADTARCELLHDLMPQCPDLKHIINCDDGLQDLLNKASDSFVPVNTLADDPAFLIYTSGTTGPPKGALGAHRCLLGNLTGFELSQNYFPEENDVFWTPADWAWTGGLLDALIPSWVYGRPVLGYETTKFDPERVCCLLEKYRVTNGFVPPTALKMLRQYESIDRHTFHFRAMMSAGETVGAEVYHWAEQTFGIQINEMCGQTEFNYIVGNCSALFPVKPGSMPWLPLSFTSKVNVTPALGVSELFK